MNGIHGGAETLHVEIASAADGVADMVTHDGDISIELFFPFIKDFG